MTTDTYPSMPKTVVKWTAAVAAAILLVIGLIMLIVLGFGALGRYQSRENQHNKVTNTRTEIQNQDQLIQIAIKKAEIRKQDAVGIKEAQDEISSTLTPYYLQWEAIQAQMAVAQSGKNNTIVYLPSGNMGVPLVDNVAVGNVGAPTAG